MKKKILFIITDVIPPRGGGQISTLAIAERLGKNFDVTVLTPHDGDVEKEMQGYKIIGVKRPFYLKFLKSYLKINVQNIWWKRKLKDFLTEENFDLLIAQGPLIPSTIGLNIKRLVFIRGVGQFAPHVDTVDPLKCKRGFLRYLPLFFRVQYPLLKHYRNLCVESVKKADLVACNVEYLKKVILSYTGRKALLVNSEIKTKSYKANEISRKYILFVNPTIHKGVDIMYGIAKGLPERNFLVVGETELIGRKYYNKLKDLPNVSALPKQTNMKEIYRNSSLLVNCSRCYEGFGRTPAEAMVSGVPSVVSGIGGLPEVVGDSGDIVKNIEDISEWIEKIKKYDEKKYYLKKAEVCKKRSKLLSKEVEKQYKKLIKLLKRRIK